MIARFRKWWRSVLVDTDGRRMWSYCAKTAGKRIAWSEDAMLTEKHRREWRKSARDWRRSARMWARTSPWY